MTHLTLEMRSAQDQIKRDVRAVTAHLTPLTADSLAAHQARRAVQVYAVAKAAYREHQEFMGDEPFPFDDLNPRERQHWCDVIRRAAVLLGAKS